MAGWRSSFGVAAVCVVGSMVASAQGTPITLSVDLRDAPQKLLHATETIPVTPGAMTLVFPKWIPGEHGPTGPIDNQAGLHIMGDGGQEVRWERDPVDMYSYHITVPAGVSTLTVKMDFITAATGGGFTGGGLQQREPGGAELEHGGAVSVQRADDECGGRDDFAGDHAAGGVEVWHGAGGYRGWSGYAVSGFECGDGRGCGAVYFDWLQDGVA